MEIQVEIEAGSYSLIRVDLFIWGFSSSWREIFLVEEFRCRLHFLDILSANKIISYCLATGNIIMDGVHLVISHVFIVKGVVVNTPDGTIDLTPQ